MSDTPPQDRETELLQRLGTVIARGTPYPLRWNPQFLNSSAYKAIVEGKATLRVRCRLFYRDIFRDPHNETFLYIFDPKMGAFIWDDDPSTAAIWGKHLKGKNGNGAGLSEPS